MKEVPARGYITNAKAWAKLWKAWRGQEELPPIDFQKQLVLVGATACAGNQISPGFTLDAKGDLKGGFMSTMMAGPGFAYAIAVINRAAVKTYNGQPIAKD
ncbi:MAG: hypothetical protein WCO56_19945 [Verrucomicrobiota bacterium]